MTKFYRLNFTEKGLLSHPLLKEIIAHSLNLKNFRTREAIVDFNRDNINFEGLKLNGLPEEVVEEKLKAKINHQGLFDYITHAGGQYACIQLFIFIMQNFKIAIPNEGFAEFRKMPVNRGCWQKESEYEYSFLINQEYGLAMVPEPASGVKSTVTMHGMRIDADNLSELPETEVMSFFLKMKEENITEKEKQSNIEPGELISPYEPLLTLQAKLSVKYNPETHKIEPSINFLKIYLKADKLMCSSKIFNHTFNDIEQWISPGRLLRLNQDMLTAIKITRETFKIEDEMWESQLFMDGGFPTKQSELPSEPKGYFTEWKRFLGLTSQQQPENRINNKRARVPS